MQVHRRSIFHPDYSKYYDLKANKLLEEFEKNLSRPSKYSFKKSLTIPKTFYEGLMTTVKMKKSPKKTKGLK